jgi:hypothetical protein
MEMDDGMKKKLMGVGAAALAAFVFGESQILEMDERLQALEEIHPELAQEELDAVAEEMKSDEAPVEEEGVPAEVSDAEHLELNEDDVWVPVEESSEEPVEEVIEEVEED